jgi:hypothetical protein
MNQDDVGMLTEDTIAFDPRSYLIDCIAAETFMLVLVVVGTRYFSSNECSRLSCLTLVEAHHVGDHISYQQLPVAFEDQGDIRCYLNS